MDTNIGFRVFRANTDRQEDRCKKRKDGDTEYCRG